MSSKLSAVDLHTHACFFRVDGDQGVCWIGQVVSTLPQSNWAKCGRSKVSMFDGTQDQLCTMHVDEHYGAALLLVHLQACSGTAQVCPATVPVRAVLQQCMAW